MSRIQFTPGKKGTIKNLIRDLYLNPSYNINNKCANSCIQGKVDQIKTGYNSPVQTQANRISQIITGTLGGRTTFGNFGVPANITYLGGIEGQPGGVPRPLRNKF
jgi:hypothetical protein